MVGGGFPGGAVVYLPANAGDARDTGSTLGSRRSPEVGNGKPLQYSCLENPMDRGAWWAAVHGGHKESDAAGQLSTHTGRDEGRGLDSGELGAYKDDCKGRATEGQFRGLLV